MQKRLRDQRGVAMITVLFVGAALTAVASAAAFVSVNELRSGISDRRSVEALSYAESGVDRLILDIKSNKFTLGEVRTAGCPSRPTVEVEGVVGDRGEFAAELTVWPNNPLPTTGSETCAARAQDRLRRPKLFAITSVGKEVRPATPVGSPAPQAPKRVIRVLVRIRMRPLPLAVFANNVISQGGNPKLSTVSLFTPGGVTNREQIGFGGTDNVYYIGDFYCPGEEYPFTGCTVPNAAEHIPAAVHAVGTLECTSPPKCGPANVGPNPREHTAAFPLNCTANRDSGAAPVGTSGQSQWDQSGDGGTIPTGSSCSQWNPASDPTVADGLTAPPPSSLFTVQDLARVVEEPSLSDEDYLTLKEIAQESGIYCQVAASGASQCVKAGQTWGALPNSVQNFHLSGAPAVDDNFVLYVEFENAATAETSNFVRWQAEWPAAAGNCTPPKTMIVVIRNGSFEYLGNSSVNGFALIPEGMFYDRGTGVWNGPIIANTFNRGGSTTFQLTECWFGTAPSPFVEVNPIRWQEVDR